MNYLKVSLLAMLLIASCVKSNEPTQKDKEIKASMSRIDSLKQLAKQNELELKRLEDSIVDVTNKRFEN